MITTRSDIIHFTSRLGLTRVFVFTILLLLSTPAIGQICATPGNDGNATGVNALGFGGTTVVVNTYYPGTANVAAGVTSISVGTARGAATAIAAGDLLLVIQMQDATINSSNTASYGDGVAGGSANGTTSDAGVGNHEYVQALGPVALGSVPIQSATIGSGLINSYVNANATPTQSQRRFQVIRVPQYANCEVVGTVEPAPWNGTTGGVIGMDVDGTLTFFIGSSVSTTGLGFRAGGGRVLTGPGGASTNTDYRTSTTININGSKAEGIAGTPRYVHQSFTGITPPGQVINAASGYPNGSNGRGAPGNAGGGGTDGNSAMNDQNSGGGGGGNGGTGGMGGNSWSSNLPVGGHGGAPFASASVNRLVMGGGGGAASRNNSANVQSSGGAGGGVTLIRAATITGTGTIEANGIEPNAANGLLPANDGGGGGGAGGTLVVFGNAGSLANITLEAIGGKGGDCALTDPAHGPGGGGGGGLVYVNDLLTGTISVGGGANGITTTGNIAYGATSGTPGSAFINAQITSLETCGFVPVSLAFFKTTQLKQRQVLFEWMTATENANIGFNLLGFDGRQWTRINTKLIPSKVIDSDAPQSYQLQAYATGFSYFALEDMDRFGKRTRKGSFALNRTYGTRTQLEEITWASIAREHQLADARRHASSFSNEKQPRAELLVHQQGMHRITFESLSAIGIDFSGIPINDIALTSKGQPIAIRVASDKSMDNPFFGPGWYIDFYGHIDFSLYSKFQVYQLTANRLMARRMMETAGNNSFGPRPATRYGAIYTHEENQQYSFASPLDDPWFGTQLLAQETPASFLFPFSLEDSLPSLGGQLSLVGYGVTDFPEPIDHHLIIFLNGQQIGEWYGNGLEILNQSFTIPAYGLRNGENQLRIELPADLGLPADVFHLDRFSVSYQRQLSAKADGLSFTSEARSFLVSNLQTPQPVVYAVTGSNWYHLSKLNIRETKDGFWQTTLSHPDQKAGKVTFHVHDPSDFHQPVIRLIAPVKDILNQNAQYLVITHPNFTTALPPLIQARQTQGFEVFVAEVDQIYREFSHGRVDGDAIASYIRYAYRNMGTRYVLLVGGDSYDYKNYLGGGSMSFVPTQYVRTGPIVGFAPSDAAMADVNNDLLPDLAIGRFPVRTLSELDTLIEKTLTYPQIQHANSSLFLAGKDEPSISFSGFSQHFMTLLPEPWSPLKAFVSEVGVAQSRAILVDAVNDGLAFLNFFGHSGPTVWTFDNLFSAQDVALLNNDNAPTMVAQWGCWNTYFVAPTYNTMAHKWLLSGPQGAAAVIGASTLTKVSSEKHFAPVFIEALFEPGQTLGQAILEAKQQTAKLFPELKDIYLGFHLLGDPGLILNP